MTINLPEAKQGTVVARRGKTAYFPDGFYSMQSDKEMEQFGLARGLPTAMRLYLLAVGRVNKWGHCPFKPGELLRLLGVSKPTFRKAMDSLQTAKMAAPDSTALCVVLSAQAVRRADRSEKRCTEPGHFDCQERMWVHNYGWEREPGMWEGFLADPAQRKQYATEIQYTRTTVTETAAIRLVS